MIFAHNYGLTDRETAAHNDIFVVLKLYTGNMKVNR